MPSRAASCVTVRVARQEPLHHVAVGVADVVEPGVGQPLGDPFGDAVGHDQRQEPEVGGRVDGAGVGPCAR